MYGSITENLEVCQNYLRVEKDILQVKYLTDKALSASLSLQQLGDKELCLKYLSRKHTTFKTSSATKTNKRVVQEHLQFITVPVSM